MGGGRATPGVKRFNFFSAKGLQRTSRSRPATRGSRKVGPFGHYIPNCPDCCQKPLKTQRPLLTSSPLPAQSISRLPSYSELERAWTRCSTARTSRPSTRARPSTFEVGVPLSIQWQLARAFSTISTLHLLFNIHRSTAPMGGAGEPSPTCHQSIPCTMVVEAHRRGLGARALVPMVPTPPKEAFSCSNGQCPFLFCACWPLFPTCLAFTSPCSCLVCSVLASPCSFRGVPGRLAASPRSPAIPTSFRGVLVLLWRQQGARRRGTEQQQQQQ